MTVPDADAYAASLLDDVPRLRWADGSVAYPDAVFVVFMRESADGSAVELDQGAASVFYEILGSDSIDEKVARHGLSHLVASEGGVALWPEGGEA